MRYTLFVLGLLWPASLVAASSTTIGATDAQRCFDESRLPLSDYGLTYCDNAIKKGDLTRRDLAATLSNRGIILARIGRYSEALQDHEKAIATLPNLAELYINRGNAYYHTLDYASALEDYRRAADLEAHPRHTPWYNMGLTHMRLRQLEEARQAFERALELSPGSDKIRAQLESLADP